MPRVIKDSVWIAAIVIPGLCCADVAIAACNSQVRTQADLQWSESASIVSPNRKWAIDVEANPSLNSEENRTPVTLKRCSSGQKALLFILSRLATLHWGPRGDEILVVDWPGAGRGELLFFDANRAASNVREDASQIDRVVRNATVARLGASREIVFYFPEVVAWRSNLILFSVSGETVVGRTGALRPFCYGVSLDTRTMHSKEILTEDALKKRYPKARCK